MTVAGNLIQFEYRGIGKLLRQGRLEVPPNQRSYSWREPHVSNLFRDFNEAVTGAETADEYFLGTIVLIGRQDDVPSIVDGQQRLATVTILLARIRDALFALNRKAAGGRPDAATLARACGSKTHEAPNIRRPRYAVAGGPEFDDRTVNIFGVSEEYASMRRCDDDGALFGFVAVWMVNHVLSPAPEIPEARELAWNTRAVF